MHILLQDFRGVWPIKDTRQQREYRKVGLCNLGIAEYSVYKVIMGVHGLEIVAGRAHVAIRLGA